MPFRTLRHAVKKPPQGPHMSSAPEHPVSSTPIYANYASDKVTTGAGVAIFHLATARVVVCWHSRDRYWFLPKGRRNVGEETDGAAEREGFEESGYRCRLLPLPIPHRQTMPDNGSEALSPFVTEPLWTQLLPQSRTAQYMLFWYAAETVPEAVEETLNIAAEGAAAVSDEAEAGAGDAAVERAYVVPPAYPSGLKIVDRMAMDMGVGAHGETTVYEPQRHEGTGVDEEELLYESYLLPIEEAERKLRGSIMADVVRRGWKSVKLREEIERKGSF